MAKSYSGIETGTTLDSMLASGSQFGIFPSQDIDCQDIDCQDISTRNINATGIHTVGGFFYPNGGIKDSSNSTGSSGKVLSSTGSGLAWIDPSTGSTANAVNVGTNLNSTNADQFVAFVGATSGNNPIRVDAGIKYNPSSNLLTVGSITGSIAASNVNSGTLGVDRIPSLAASKITSGQFDAARIPTLNQNTTGNAATATSATILANARTIGGVSFDGSANINLPGVNASGNQDTSGNAATATSATTAATVTTAAQTNITSLGTLTGLTVDGNITQSGTSNYIRINGAIQDKDGQSGNSGQVLSSTGSQIDWVNVGSLAAGSASQVAVSDESSDTNCFPLFVTASTGNQAPKSGSNLTFNSSTGALSATSFSGSIAASNINSGTLGTDRIPSLAASKITSGTLGTDRIPNLAASKITSGTLGTARIPNLAASKITSGTLGTDRIPSLAASKITSGQFDTARIPTLNQNTTGTSGGLSGSPSITVTNITIDGQLRDGDNAFGSSGQVLSSDGTDTKWINAGSLSAGAAAQVAVNATNTTNSSHFITFTETSSGNEEIRVDNSLTYNPSTNVLTAGTFSGSVAASNVDSGTLATGRIPNLAASKITSGTLGTDRIPSLDASKITSGTLGTDRIPNLAASKITSGQFNTARIPTLNQDTTGTADKAETARITTDNTSALRPLLFIASSGNSNAAVNNTFAPLRFSPTIYSLSYNPNTEKFYVNHAQFSGNIVAYGTGRVGDTFTVKGSEGTDAIIELNADEGDDNDDKWRIRSDATGNNLKFETYTSGSWSDGSPLQLASNGIVTMPGQAVIDEVNINGNVVQTNTSNELVVRGEGTGGSHHLKLDDDVTIVGDLTVQGVGGFVTGMILLWSGAANAIPSGWYLCNGSNGTPDLRGRFVVGYNNTDSDYDVGDTGGAKNRTVTISGSDTVTISDSPSTLNGDITLGSNGTGAMSTAGAKSLTVNVSASDTVNISGSDTFDNRPPYYALCYIMKS